MKNTVNKMENILEGIKIRLEDAEELISALEDGNGKHSNEQQKGKRTKRNKKRLRNLCNSMKHPNICNIGVSEGKKRGKGVENLFEEIIAENCPK